MRVAVIEICAVQVIDPFDRRAGLQRPLHRRRVAEHLRERHVERRHAHIGEQRAHASQLKNIGLARTAARAEALRLVLAVLVVVDPVQIVRHIDRVISAVLPSAAEGLAAVAAEIALHPPAKRQRLLQKLRRLLLRALPVAAVFQRREQKAHNIGGLPLVVVLRPIVVPAAVFQRAVLEVRVCAQCTLPHQPQRRRIARKAPRHPVGHDVPSGVVQCQIRLLTEARRHLLIGKARFQIAPGRRDALCRFLIPGRVVIGLHCDQQHGRLPDHSRPVHDHAAVCQQDVSAVRVRPVAGIEIVQRPLCHLSVFLFHSGLLFPSASEQAVFPRPEQLAQLSLVFRQDLQLDAAACNVLRLMAV